MTQPTSHDWALAQYGEDITDPETLRRIEHSAAYQFAVLNAALVEFIGAVLLADKWMPPLARWLRKRGL